MTRKLSFFVLLAFLSLDLFACHRATVPSKADTVAAGDDMEEQILYYTNKFRASQGKPPLKLDAACSKQAYSHSKDMANGSTGFGHEGFEGRIANLTKVYGSIPDAAENVAYGTLDAKGVVDGWIKSPGHRKNMLGNYNLIGIGAVHGKQYNGRIIFFTQVFIQKPAK